MIDFDQDLALLAWLRLERIRLAWKDDAMRANGGRLSPEDEAEDARLKAKQEKFWQRAALARDGDAG